MGGRIISAPTKKRKPDTAGRQGCRPLQRSHRRNWQKTQHTAGASPRPTGNNKLGTNPERRAVRDAGPYKKATTPQKHEKGRSDGEGHSCLNLFYGRGGEAELRTKFFAKLSFKKAGAVSHKGLLPAVLSGKISRPASPPARPSAR